MCFECKNISFQYPNSDAYVFKNIDCQISDAGFHALFGPSGIGKTTFARIISNKINGFSGKIISGNITSILYSYNMERLPGWYDVKDHLNDVALSSKKERMNELVCSFGLQECLNSRFSQLSMGQQNRVNLTRYLLQDFDLLVMDESLANVDEMTREKIILKIKKMFPEKSFLYISHHIAEVAKFCKEILVFRSPHKTPQVVSVKGQNYMEGEALNSKAIEGTMLEIMHAS